MINVFHHRELNLKRIQLHIWGNTHHLFGKIHFARKSPQKLFIFTESISKINTITLQAENNILAY